MRIAILTEANAQVASGHLFEAMELAGALYETGEDTLLFINDDCPSTWKERIQLLSLDYRATHDSRCIIEKMGSFSPNLIVTDLRFLDNTLLENLRSACKCPIIAIDEWGNRVLNADIIINPMICPKYWCYETNAKSLYCGEQYLILKNGIEEFHHREKYIEKRISRIVVTFGGVDQYGTSLIIAKKISKRLPNITFDLILGGGFAFKRQLDDFVQKSQGRSSIRTYTALPSIYELVYGADLVICSGGNTLHECACIGTPAIVIPNAPHEKDNAHCFEARGFGKALNSGDTVTEEEIMSAIQQMDAYELRSRMCRLGRKICDGRGLSRTIEIVKSMLNENNETPR